MRYIAEKRLTSTPEVALRLPVNAEGKVVTEAPLVQQEAQLLLDEGRRFAQERIRANFPFFRALAGALMIHGHVDSRAIARVWEETAARVRAAGGEENLPRYQREPRGVRCAQLLIRGPRAPFATPVAPTTQTKW